MTGRYCPFFFQSGISGADNTHDVQRFHQALQHLVLFTGSDENLEQEGFRQNCQVIEPPFGEAIIIKPFSEKPHRRNQKN